MRVAFRSWIVVSLVLGAAACARTSSPSAGAEPSSQVSGAGAQSELAAATSAPSSGASGASAATSTPSSAPTTELPAALSVLSAQAPAALGACPSGLVRVPGGDFWVGSPGSQGPEDEHPRFLVRVGDFCMAPHEVTVEAYERCVQSGACSSAKRDNLTCNGGRGDRPTHPINCVDFEQASAYCQSVGARLPTEVEWEFAARGGPQQLAFPFGDAGADGHVCWKAAGTCPVGSFTSGPYGLFDLAGNVWEWTSSHYGPYPYGDPDNPNRVYRGGSWSRRFEKWLSPTLRNRFGPKKWGSHLGVRCAADVGTADGAAASGAAANGAAASNGAAAPERPSDGAERREVLDVECGADARWNGYRCAPADAPLCRPGAVPVAGQGCVRPTVARHDATASDAPAAEPVTFARSPEFDADCREYQPKRPRAYRLSGATHEDRTSSARARGCKNRDVGVGWNSACCPD